MPNLFRTLDGKVWKPGEAISFTLADGAIAKAVWAGSATEEKLAWWLNQSGNQLGQTEIVAAVASKADDDKELIWGDAPAEAHLLFVVVAPAPGDNYRLAKLITTAATPAQEAFFRHDRASLFGHINHDGSIMKIPPLEPPPPPPKAQGELF